MVCQSSLNSLDIYFHSAVVLLFNSLINDSRDWSLNSPISFNCWATILFAEYCLPMMMVLVKFFNDWLITSQMWQVSLYIADATDICFPFKKNGEQKSVLHYIYIGMVFLKKTITRSRKDIVTLTGLFTIARLYAIIQDSMNSSTISCISKLLPWIWSVSHFATLPSLWLGAFLRFFHYLLPSVSRWTIW